MTLWILAFLVLASVAALGYRQGAIRVAISFLGIVVGALLAVPLAGLIKPVLKVFGLKHPVLLYLLAPVVVFLIISVVFKVAAAALHQKADVFYRYRVSDLHAILWERMNRRLGLCLGVLNGVAYMVLLAFLIYPLSYATYQVASSEEDPRWMRIINSLGEDMSKTGFAKVARAIDRRTTWYEAADLMGVLYHNPLLEARVARYPAFLGLSEQNEFKEIGRDRAFSELRDRREPIMNVLNHPSVQSVMQNTEMLKTIWATLLPDIKDFRSYLATGMSEKYDRERILGRWVFDVSQAMVMARRAKPNMSSKEAGTLKRWIEEAFRSTSMVAMTDHQVLLKNLPTARQPVAGQTAGGGNQNLTGEWKAADGQYEITISGTPVKATVDRDRLRMNFEGTDLAFSREI